jgi:ribosomal protein L2
VRPLAGIFRNTVPEEKKEESITKNVEEVKHAEARTIPVLTVKFRQPSHEYTFSVGISFVSYPLVLTPVV